jgi:uncharacterized protein YjiS (DUF1127 family)
MFDQVKFRVRSWRRYRRALAELEIHSDRELAELGFLRCDLPRVARETVGR